LTLLITLMIIRFIRGKVTAHQVTAPVHHQAVHYLHRQTPVQLDHSADSSRQAS